MRSVSERPGRSLIAAIAFCFACAAIGQERAETLEVAFPALPPDTPDQVFERPARLVYGFLYPSSFGTSVPGTVTWTIGRNSTIVTAEARFPVLDLAVTIEIASPAEGALVVDVTWTGEFPRDVAGLEDATAQLDDVGHVNRTLAGFDAIGDTHFRLIDPRGRSWLDMDQLLGMADLTLHFAEVGAARSRSMIILDGGGGARAEPAAIPRQELGYRWGPAFNPSWLVWPSLWTTENHHRVRFVVARPQ
jgi:hypothetical protein